MSLNKSTYPCVEGEVPEVYLPMQALRRLLLWQDFALDSSYVGRLPRISAARFVQIKKRTPPWFVARTLPELIRQMWRRRGSWLKYSGRKPVRLHV